MGIICIIVIARKVHCQRIVQISIDIRENLSKQTFSYYFLVQFVLVCANYILAFYYEIYLVRQYKLFGYYIMVVKITRRPIALQKRTLTKSTIHPILSLKHFKSAYVIQPHSVHDNGIVYLMISTSYVRNTFQS